MILIASHSGIRDSRSSDAIPWPHVKRLQRIESVVCESLVSEEAFGVVSMGVGEVLFVVVDSILEYAHRGLAKGSQPTASMEDADAHILRHETVNDSGAAFRDDAREHGWYGRIHAHCFVKTCEHV
jgi:hypothetical protein